jgi:hypothetical protein
MRMYSCGMIRRKAGEKTLGTTPVATITARNPRYSFFPIVVDCMDILLAETRSTGTIGCGRRRSICRSG